MKTKKPTTKQLIDLKTKLLRQKQFKDWLDNECYNDRLSLSINERDKICIKFNEILIEVMSE